MDFDHLARLLDPYPLEEFLASSWGKTYKHIPGWPGKFRHHLPWGQLNEILRRHRLDFPRLRLMQNGKSLPTSSYLRHVTGGRRKTPIPRLLPVALMTQLRQGATLVLDAVDELYQPLERLAEGLEWFFHERIQINAYAGWQTSRGFDLHWDDHDVFILQVTGRKRWGIYGVTRPYPLAQDREHSQKPDQEPLWETVLEDGNVLYIPRGWWHAATPLAEPTLHLTVGVHNRTGIDLLRWLTDRMCSSEVFRKDLPRFASGPERAEHLERLRSELIAEWDESLLERYYDDSDAMARPRPYLSLPWGATSDALPHSDDTLVRLTAPRPFAMKVDSNRGVVEFSCNGKRWQFASESMAILSRLAEARACSVSELCEVAGGQLEERTIRTFLNELIDNGLLTIVSD